MRNDVLPGDDVAERIARQTRERRGGLDYADEVRRLLAAALEVMRARGTASRPRVADIVAAAGLSNDAFYRHFSSKEALVTALLEDGAAKLGSYLAHQLGKESEPAAQVRRWVEGVMSQTDEDIAATTLAVLYNGGSVGQGAATGRHPASVPLGTLLHEPFAALGSTSPEFDASLAANAIFGKLSDYLWTNSRPTPAELDRMTTFCLAAITGGTT
ncbi:TetR/AcrR family transcriptional regulator [Cryptosporangium phraense]|uniref:TetR family transcriptional regulator n=1 Tax=Cryptosporangium phraense TaxID=2593070 RepID=A0A545B0A9_9ACTN|nr:TetR/AcrR family transcriptional regulator [Cryptosporangium phraense]TQS46994.1 TetR family transcriptional regulator [Cryptosporangium phraense]